MPDIQSMLAALAGGGSTDDPIAGPSQAQPALSPQQLELLQNYDAAMKRSQANPDSKLPALPEEGYSQQFRREYPHAHLDPTADPARDAIMGLGMSAARPIAEGATVPNMTSAAGAIASALPIPGAPEAKGVEEAAMAAPAISRGLRLTTPEGLAVQGKDFTKASQGVLKDIAAGPKGAGPLDLTAQNQIPNTPQVPLERIVPPRGVSPRLVEAMQNKNVTTGIANSMNAGTDVGADKWYHTEPLRQAWVNALGAQKGGQDFAKYMDYVAATSPRSDVPTNIRNASYYYQHGVNNMDLPDKLPYPYGHVAQNLHRQNFNSLSSGATPGGFDIFQNPKPASFSQNLQGNLAPVTVDTHAFRNIGMRTGDPRFLATSLQTPVKAGENGPESMISKYGEIKNGNAIFRPQQLVNEGRLSMNEAKNIPSFWSSMPNPNEYGAAEQLYTKIGAGQGLAPADAQAAAWSGAGKLTGLGSPPTHTFPELFNERVQYTARMRGEDPQQTLHDLITGKKPLLSIGGAAGAGGAALASQQPDNEKARMIRALSQ